MEYKDLTEEEKLILNMRRADSWRYANQRFLEIAVKTEKDEQYTKKVPNRKNSTGN